MLVKPNKDLAHIDIGVQHIMAAKTGSDTMEFDTNCPLVVRSHASLVIRSDAELSCLPYLPWFAF